MQTFALASILGVVAFSQVGPNNWWDSRANSDPDARHTFAEMCAENGFQLEVHEVTTEDGYILNVFRIPGQIVDNEGDQLTTLSELSSVTKPPILFQHGIIDSAFCWIVNYAEVAPAFVAARAGYDVWLGNSRGNTYSLGHTTWDHNKDEKEYWDFSWYEMGQYDLPAVIDMIQEKTEGQKVAYVGHSQGTTQMFAALSENQSYFADKVPIFVALGPVTKVSHTEAELAKFSVNFYDELADTCSLLGIHELLGANWFTSGVSQLFCSNIPEFCKLISALFVTHNPSLDDNDRFGVYMGHQPNGASVKAVLHYAQNQREDRFQVFSDDYMDFYKRHEKRTTDLIPLENISEVPVAIFTGKDDIMADVTDARWTRDLIGNSVVHYEEVEAGHLTFLVGKDMTYFSEGVMSLLREYHPLPGSDEATYERQKEEKYRGDFEKFIL